MLEVEASQDGLNSSSSSILHPLSDLHRIPPDNRHPRTRRYRNLADSEPKLAVRFVASKFLPLARYVPNLASRRVHENKVYIEDRRPTDRPRILENFERPYLGNGSSDPLHLWCYGRVFEVGGSSDATCGFRKSKMAAGRHKKMSNGHISATGHAIHFAFGSLAGFSGRPIECLYFRLDQNQDHGRQPSCIILNGHISETVHLIQFVFGTRVTE